MQSGPDPSAPRQTKLEVTLTSAPPALPRASLDAVGLGPGSQGIPRRRLGPPTVLSGRKRRWINPEKGLLKVFEREMDILVSRFLYPHISRVWNPYSWVLERRFSFAETRVQPHGWPANLDPIRVLLISDIHTGIFLHAGLLQQIVSAAVTDLKPDLVAIAGDIVTGHSSELGPFLDALRPLARAPLGAWYCHGNHDYFGGDPAEIRDGLRSIEIRTLSNQGITIKHGHGEFVLGGIDDLIMGKPDWQQVARNGRPHLLLAHNPDHFFEAESRRIPLTLSGHTHGGQIRFRYGPPVIRQSRYCLDEGVFLYHESLLVVSRGLGAVGLPWRWGAFPEAVLIEISASKS